MNCFDFQMASGSSSPPGLERGSMSPQGPDRGSMSPQRTDRGSISPQDGLERGSFSPPPGINTTNTNKHFQSLSPLTLLVLFYFENFVFKT